MEKEILFSVTASDCDWDYFRGSGDGGQKKQKTSSGARCVHRESGASGQATDTRSQLQNKKLAFQRMVATQKFKDWVKRKTSKDILTKEQIEAEVDRSMVESNLEVSTFKNGKWEKYDGGETDTTECAGA